MPFPRRQLTLFVPAPESDVLERIRATYNPVQCALIKSHVTLCREDELPAPEKVIEILNKLPFSGITLSFGPPVRVENGKGVLLPANGDNRLFDALRRTLLGTDTIRNLEPHITVMHPRNSTCTDKLFELICRETFPQSITFPKISFIEQSMATSNPSLPGGRWKAMW